MRRGHNGKVRYRTMEKAAAVAEEYNERVPIRFGDLQPYPCPWCPRFHVGYSTHGKPLKKEAQR